MVNRANDGELELFHQQNAVTQTLVVVYHVELAVSRKPPELAVRSQAKRERLRKPTQHHRGHFIKVERIHQAQRLRWKTPCPTVGIQTLQLVYPDGVYDDGMRIP